MGVRAGTLALSGVRWAPLDETIRLAGIDLTDAVMEAHVRLTFDTPGTPLILLGTVTTPNTEGLRVASVAVEDGVPVSYLALRVNETTMEGLPQPGVTAAGEVGDDLVLHWDLHINPSAALNPDLPAIKQRYLKGTFTVEAGATQ